LWNRDKLPRKGLVVKKTKGKRRHVGGKERGDAHIRIGEGTSRGGRYASHPLLTRKKGTKKKEKSHLWRKKGTYRAPFTNSKEKMRSARQEKGEVRTGKRQATVGKGERREWLCPRRLDYMERRALFPEEGKGGKENYGERQQKIDSLKEGKEKFSILLLKPQRGRTGPVLHVKGGSNSRVKEG